jgi:hypothetical protein
MPRTHLTLKKPRTEGRKYITEKLVGLDKGTLEVLDPLGDVVKIYSVLPLLISEDSKKLSSLTITIPKFLLELLFQSAM